MSHLISADQVPQYVREEEVSSVEQPQGQPTVDNPLYGQGLQFNQSGTTVAFDHAGTVPPVVTRSLPASDSPTSPGQELEEEEEADNSDIVVLDQRVLSELEMTKYPALYRTTVTPVTGSLFPLATSTPHQTAAAPLPAADVPAAPAAAALPVESPTSSQTSQGDASGEENSLLLVGDRSSALLELETADVPAPDMLPPANEEEWREMWEAEKHRARSASKMTSKLLKAQAQMRESQAEREREFQAERERLNARIMLEMRRRQEADEDTRTEFRKNQELREKIESLEFEVNQLGRCLDDMDDRMTRTKIERGIIVSTASSTSDLTPSADNTGTTAGPSTTDGTSRRRGAAASTSTSTAPKRRRSNR